ncbi:MAG TPA: hypothetical protein VH475_28795 [Tepidisphaeraceae bacterium]|jgi:hypothetical protein
MNPGKPFPRRRVCVTLTLLLLLAVCARAEEAVKIEKEAPAVEYKRFDPSNPPNPPPPLDKGEAAVTVYRFGVTVDSRYSYTQPAKPPQGPVKMDITVEEISVKLGLSITIWLPDNASRELAAHEEGHRTITQAFYGDAEQTMRGLAQRWVGKKVTGQGPDAKAAARSAIDQLSRKLCDEYLNAVNTPCEKAQTVFDRLTDHGRNVQPAAAEGVKQALEEVKKTRE